VIDGQAALDVFRANGLKLQPAINAVESGIWATWQLLSTGKLKVFRSLGNWIDEFRLYQRDEDGKVKKEHDHLMDAMRYLIMSGRDVMRAKAVEAKEPRYSYDFGHNSGQQWMQ
jgi:hypothetical protein